MENIVNSWLSFAGKVEAELPRLGQEFSTHYVENLSRLTRSIRREVQNLPQKEDQNAAFMRITELATELKGTAFFISDV